MGIFGARVISVAPDPLAIARALVAAGWPGVALLHAAEPGAGVMGLGRFSFVAAGPDRTSDRLDPLAGDPGSSPDSALAFVPRWIGVLPYEGRRASLERAGWAPDEAARRPRRPRPRGSAIPPSSASTTTRAA